MGARWGGTAHGDGSTAVGNLQSCKPLCVREPLRCSYTRACLHDTGVVCVQLYSVSLQPRLHTTRGIILSHVWRWRVRAVSFSRSTNPSLRRQWIKLPWILNYTCCLPSASRASQRIDPPLHSSRNTGFCSSVDYQSRVCIAGALWRLHCNVKVC